MKKSKRLNGMPGVKKAIVSFIVSVILLGHSAVAQEAAVVQDVLSNLITPETPLDMDGFVMNPVDESGLLTNSDDLMTDGEIDDFGNGQGQVPVDGGLSLLLAAGALYGGRRLAKRYRE
jgi:hypothetical protein